MNSPQTLLGVPSTQYAAAGVIGEFPLSNIKTLKLDATVVSFTGGTAPTATLILEHLGADGTWYAIYTSSALSAAGIANATVGNGLSTNQEFGPRGRLRFTLSGAPTNVNISASVYGGS